MKKHIVVMAIVTLAALCGAAGANSLWRPTSGSMFADHRAHKVGDILTVLIAESSSTKHSAKTDSDKEFDVSGGPGTGFFDLIDSFSLGAERSSSGSGSSTQTTNLIDRVSVRVVEVLPNGLLRVHGERQVQLQADELKLSLDGLVRKQDVSATNTVLSSQVAELQIASTGKGPTSDTQKPGLIYRIIRWLF